MRVKGLLKIVACVPFLACAKPGVAFVNAVASIKGQKTVKDVSFGEQPRHLLDVYSPSGAIAPENLRPVIVFFYGSGWTDGTKNDYAFVAEAFTSRGYLVVVPDYGKHPDVIFPEFVEDGAKAVGWVYRTIQEFGGDPSKLLFLGHSAGGHLAALLNADHSYLAQQGVPRDVLLGVAGLAGPYDFVPKEEIFKQVFVKAGSSASAAMATTYLDGQQAPMLALYGLKDTRVGLSNITRLQAGISEKGGLLRVKLYEQLGHVDIVSSLSIPLRRKAPVLDDILSFFAELITSRTSRLHEGGDIKN